MRARQRLEGRFAEAIEKAIAARLRELPSHHVVVQLYHELRHKNFGALCARALMQLVLEYSGLFTPQMAAIRIARVLERERNCRRVLSRSPENKFLKFKMLQNRGAEVPTRIPVLRDLKNAGLVIFHTAAQATGAFESRDGLRYRLRPAIQRYLAKFKTMEREHVPDISGILSEPESLHSKFQNSVKYDPWDVTRCAVRSMNRNANADMQRFFQGSALHLENLDALSYTPWAIEGRVLDVALELFREPWDPTAAKPVWVNNREGRILWMLWKQQIKKRWAVRRRMNRAICLAREWRGRSLYYRHFMDFRGRAYPSDGFLALIGGDLAKGLLRAPEPQPLTDEGEESFLTFGALLAAPEARTWAPWKRAEWARENSRFFRDIAANPFKTRGLWEKTDDPWQLLQYAFAYEDWKQTGANAMRISCDATASGFQVLAMILKDLSLGRAVNLVEDEPPHDLYTELAEDAQRHLACLSGPALWFKWMGGAIPRSLMKALAMPIPYGVTKYGFRAAFLEWMWKEAMDRQDPVLLRQDREEWIESLVDTLWEWLCQQSLVVPTVKLMEHLREINVKHWRTPLQGFPVWATYPDTPYVRVHTITQGRIPVYIDSEKVAKRRQHIALAANIVHSLDADILHTALKDVRYEGLQEMGTLHDGFFSHANDIPLWYRSVRDAYARICDSNFLDDFARQTRTPPFHPISSGLTANHILGSCEVLR